MNRLMILILGTLLVGGCIGSDVWRDMRVSSTESEAKLNNQKIMNLTIGQPRNEVLDVMGPPAKREAYQLANQRVVEFLFYRTSGWAVDDWRDKDYQFTPFAFEENKLVGWGRNYYDNVVRTAVEITTR